ncbi:MAG: RNase adapter RapZ [Pseudomonadota bacterium]|nr:RNase adapter RapZ [Gammaproteobacteria bacterium]MBU1629099.1 RNase adapter RapZ [Gammaproteobacteria bacterium]MBU2545678.1 RNase adapter RapZ [Gammaproteobacteria bacterium]
MKLMIVSGRSGSGKSVALNALEDLGYYCIDNLPLALLSQLAEHVAKLYQHIAVSLDVRNVTDNTEDLNNTLDALKQAFETSEIMFLDAKDEILLNRFSETRRRHPLTNKTTSLSEALTAEKKLLQPIANIADIHIDTTHLNIKELRDLIYDRLHSNQKELALLIKSFGFKHGAPPDANFVFDVRCLPNPHWEQNLRHQSGLELPVIDFLEKFPQVTKMENMIRNFIETWIPAFRQEGRRYLTVAIGCTGGHHRSVYIVEKLGKYFEEKGQIVAIRHRDNF